jgi:hypothetical protein
MDVEARLPKIELSTSLRSEPKVIREEIGEFHLVRLCGLLEKQSAKLAKILLSRQNPLDEDDCVDFEANSG